MLNHLSDRTQRRGGDMGDRGQLAGVRVLVVENNEDMRDLLHESLRLLGASVSAVASARDAVSQAADIDIILTDVALPGEDGVWLWEWVNRQPRPIPVIALTGYTADQYPRIKEAAFARTLLKPVAPDDVAKAVWEVLRGPGRVGVGDTSRTPAPGGTLSTDDAAAG